MGQRTIRTICIAMLVVGFTFTWLAFSEFLATDRCLDRGGRWNSVERACELPDGQRYRARWLESPQLACAGVIVIIIAVAGLARRRPGQRDVP
jgi:choline-glycine betaine transporter